MVQAIGSSTPAMTGLSRPSGPPPDPKEVFSRSDSDSDGTLKTDELQVMLDEIAEKMGGGGLSAEDLIAKLDTDGDGALNSEEFDAGRPEGPPPAMGYDSGGKPEDETRRLGLNLKV
jgi:hypothetical protein